MVLKLLVDFWSTQDGKGRAHKCGLLLLTATILAFLLPYDSNGELDFVLGAGEWLGHALILMASSGITARWLFPRLTNTNTLIAMTLYSAINAVPVLLLSIVFDYILVSYNTPLSYGADIYLWWIAESFVLTLLVIGSISIVAIKFEFSEYETKATTSPQPGQKFLNRLSPEMGADLICLEMEDHYLRVHTAKGSILVHMRMTDAVNELENFPGFQVHRSWWISADAIETISKQNRDYKAQLKNGMMIPISRSRVDTLKEKGFL
ncbi:LytTR family DNA-binding domain-containing protein [Kordiimonas aquimaris]|uniref:LytTR family DNA-binding domain-containing protein n=1 Tax=Kordiimonas aquimaris TaxID=707591 RepID=UPI0021D3EAFE|nr:LytTR family DNA-binding domain-containing protein [Kordiimonas aquimaris]